jgi:hypothetical protein
MRALGRMPAAAGLAAAALLLAACNIPGDTGYVEIRTVPAAGTTSTPLYLDTVKLDPVRKGVAVLKHRTGTAKLATDGSGGKLAALCDVQVQKNRITTVTISVLERPPRCQCRNARDKSVCVS